MPNSPTLMNAGDELQQLSACFVMSPDDDLSDIHETAKKAAEVFRSDGVGYGFWKHRPFGDSVGSTGESPPDRSRSYGPIHILTEGKEVYDPN
ncbi:hypothetical protein HALLA_12180 [Halostagnicola larsenii XH-48]|uniref:Ribonucleotide reductase large subunit C-terminal domain-containing protein n=1 Tax=Halostagnicola larsenii XH-48 TaxID=797299 RepID=W0JUL1_9EURY|nr:hypothetical protein HALLA_11870 [Halostagnicola larsenii XH-48]AHG00981.1 hypothetical protein HALLA_12180 [Halostagnicola larsenii XH-48]